MVKKGDLICALSFFLLFLGSVGLLVPTIRYYSFVFVALGLTGGYWSARHTENREKHTAIQYDNAIGLIKIVALLKVITLHFARWWQMYIPIFFLGGFSLRLFVICSGFGLMKLTLQYSDTFKKLIWHQMKKLYIGLALGVLAVVLGRWIAAGSVAVSLHLKQAIFVLIGLYAEEPRLILSRWVDVTQYPTTNGALWFISVILWLYLLFPFIHYAFTKWKQELVLALLFLLSFFGSRYFDPTYKSILYNLFFFAIGMYFALHYNQIRSALHSKVVVVTVFILGFIVLALAPFSKVYHFSFEVFLFFILYILFSLPWFAQFGWVRKYDKIVFFLYLIHQPFIGILGLRWIEGVSIIQNVSHYGLYLFITIMISYLLLRLFQILLRFEHWSELLNK